MKVTVGTLRRIIKEEAGRMSGGMSGVLKGNPYEKFVALLDEDGQVLPGKEEAAYAIWKGLSSDKIVGISGPSPEPDEYGHTGFSRSEDADKEDAHQYHMDELREAGLEDPESLDYWADMFTKSGREKLRVTVDDFRRVS